MSIYLSAAATSTYVQYNLRTSTNGYNKSIEQLSSGNKITAVADDPAGVSKIAKLDVQLGGNSNAQSNVSTGMDLLTDAEGAQSIVTTSLQRIRDLAVQASTGTYTDSDRNAMLGEMQSRLTEINRLADTTNINGVYLLNGSSSNLSLQIGANSAASINVGAGLIDVHTAALGVDLGAVSSPTWTTADAQAYLNNIDTALDTISTSTSQLGGYMNRLDDATSNLVSTQNAMKSSRSLTADTDVASTSADMVKYQILQQASVSILTQANQFASMALSLLKSS